MVKGSSRKQKGIQKGVQKSKISRRNQDAESVSVSSSETEKKIGKIAEKCWGHVLQTTSKWYLIPIEVEAGGAFVRPMCLWKWLVHYAIASVYFVIMMYKLIVTLHRAYSKLDLYTYMCACSFIVLFIPATAMIGITFLPRKFCSLLNCWPQMLNDVEEKIGKKKSVFDDKVVSLEVGCLVIVVYSAAINTACYSLVADIPNCVLPTLVNAGLVHTSPTLPKIVWRLLFLPLEILTLLPPMLVVGVTGMTIVISLGILNLHADVAR